MSDPPRPGPVEFIRLVRDGQDDVVITELAFRMNVYAVTTMLLYRTGGFISDDHIDTAPGDATSAAIELTLVGEWRRVEGGYEIVNPDHLALARELEIRDGERGCLEAECAHIRDPFASPHCVRCGERLG